MPAAPLYGAFLAAFPFETSEKKSQECSAHLWYAIPPYKLTASMRPSPLDLFGLRALPAPRVRICSLLSSLGACVCGLLCQPVVDRAFLRCPRLSDIVPSHLYTRSWFWGGALHGFRCIPHIQGAESKIIGSSVETLAALPLLYRSASRRNHWRPCSPS